jgi:protein involved in ribonucleotide reduction
MPNNTNYGELFCEAIDIIAKQRTQEVMYDKTVLGTIEDDSQAADGIYTVSYNQTKF